MIRPSLAVVLLLAYCSCGHSSERIPVYLYCASDVPVIPYRIERGPALGRACDTAGRPELVEVIPLWRIVDAIRLFDGLLASEPIANIEYVRRPNRPKHYRGEVVNAANISVYEGKVETLILVGVNDWIQELCLKHAVDERGEFATIHPVWEEIVSFENFKATHVKETTQPPSKVQ
jgi:hypothetical protein